MYLCSLTQYASFTADIMIHLVFIAIILNTGATLAGEDNLDKIWLEDVFKKADLGSSTKRLISFDLLPKQTNACICADIQEVRLKLETNSGKIVDNSALIFSLPETKYRRQFCNDSGMFRNDLLVYKKVIPLMEDLMEEFNDHSERIWMEPIGFGEDGDKFVLQDIFGEYGYRRRTNLDYLDPMQAKFVLKNLAKFHAMSAVLYTRGLLSVEDFGKFIFEKPGFNIFSYTEKIFKKMLEAMRAYPTLSKWPEWKIARMEKLNLFSLDDYWNNTNDSKFKVLNHGSFVLSNIYFKHAVTDAHTSAFPLSLRTSGFHTAFLDSPVYDMFKFSLTGTDSTDGIVMGDIAHDYVRSLDYYLEKFNYTGSPLEKRDYIFVKKWSLISGHEAINHHVFSFSANNTQPDWENIAKNCLESGELPVADYKAVSEDLFKKVQTIYKVS